MPLPWLTLALSFSAGVLLAAPAWLAACLACAAAALRRRPGLALPTLALAAGALVGSGAQRWAERAPPDPAGPVEGTVAAVILRGGRAVVQVAPDQAPAWRVQISQGHRPAGLAPGARVRVQGPLLPLDPADNPGGFDAAAYGAAEGVRWRAAGPMLLRTPAPAAAEAVIQAREGARARLDDLRRPFGAALLQGLLLGDRAAVPPAAAAALEASGAGHLLAVSGLHVGGLAALLFALGWRLANRLGVARPDRVAAWLALPAVPAFVLLAQAPVSAQRAGLMVAAWLLARSLDRRPAGLELLGLAALAVLAHRPQAVFEPGFQLSFGAVAALLCAPARGGRLRQALWISLVAWAATAPVQAWHFGTAAPVAPLANLVLTPLAATVVVPLGLLGLAVAGWTTWPLELAAACAEGLVALAEGCAGLVGLQVVGAHAAPALAIPVAVGALWLAGHPRLARAAPVALLGLSAALWPWGDRVDFVAVGQGDAALVRSGGAAWLVDAGPDLQARDLLGFLRNQGVRRLDGVVLSHRHPDHYGGLVGLAEILPLGRVYDHGLPEDDGSWSRLAASLRRRGVPVEPPPAAWSIGDFAVQTLNLDPPAGLSENDRSVVLWLRGPHGSLLLTGDVEGPAEARLAGQVPRSLILKAPHHGSKTSSGPALLAEACPAAVVFPVGRHNRYGFPHAPVLARYQAAGVQPWRTDQDGWILARLDRDPPTLEALRRKVTPVIRQGCPQPPGVP